MFEIEEESDSEGVEDWNYEFSSLKDEIKREVEEEEQRRKRPAEQSSFEFDFTNGFDHDEEEEVHEDEVNIADAFHASPSTKQVRLAQERAEREAMFNDKKFEMATEEFKERLDVPAYERKKIKLQNVPHSAERNISKFNLNEENQILGNNKFLHDNVD